VFCQAEDGIRDRNVTGVQTCALPISESSFPRLQSHWSEDPLHIPDTAPTYDNRICLRLSAQIHPSPYPRHVLQTLFPAAIQRLQIGRASCRERVQILVVVV